MFVHSQETSVSKPPTAQSVVTIISTNATAQLPTSKECTQVTRASGHTPAATSQVTRPSFAADSFIKGLPCPRHCLTN